MKTGIYAALIKNRKILLVRNKNLWILPGGNLNENENHLECLVREIKEELSGTEIIVNRYYNSFEGLTPHSQTPLKAFVYFVQLKGKLKEPSAEIFDRKFVTNSGYYEVSPVTKEIIDSLAKEGYLK